MLLALAVAALALAVAGCGGGEAPAPAPAEAAAATTTAAAEAATTGDAPAADAAEVFPAEGEPRAVVVLLHGWTDLDPEPYRPWIDHLTAQGATVVFPNYQESILSSPADMLAGSERGIREGLEEVGDDDDVPVVAAGFSLGGALAVDYAANAGDWGVPAPDAVYAVFPAPPLGGGERMAGVPRATEVVFVVGDRDAVVGAGGAAALAEAIAPHPSETIRLASSAGAAWDHLAPLRDDDAVRARIWAPLDAIVDRLAAR
jgi:dienelactone hydrolase